MQMICTEVRGNIKWETDKKTGEIGQRKCGINDKRQGKEGVVETGWEVEVWCGLYEIVKGVRK